MVKFDTLYSAEVINNKDPQEEGRVQIYIPTFMSGWKQALYPWARPFFNGTGGNFGDTDVAMNCVPAVANTPPKQFIFGDLDIPEKKTLVWIWFEKFKEKQNAFYLTGLQLQKSTPAKSFGKLAGHFITEVKGKYPDVKFRVAPNGYVKFHSSNIDVIESGEYNSRRSYIFQQDDQTTAGADVQLTRILNGTTNQVQLKSTTATQTQEISIGQLATLPLNQNFIKIIKNIVDQQIIMQSDVACTITMSQLTKIVTIVATQVVMNAALLSAGVTAPPSTPLTLLGAVNADPPLPVAKAVSTAAAISALASAILALNPIAQTPASIAAVGTATGAVPGITSANVLVN